jgi:hypothetical protein
MLQRMNLSNLLKTWKVFSAMVLILTALGLTIVSSAPSGSQAQTTVRLSGDYIGYGVNIFDFDLTNIASQLSAKSERIVDTTGLQVTQDNVKKTVNSQLTGTSAEEYANEVAKSIGVSGSYGPVSGSASLSTNSSTSTSKSAFFEEFSYEVYTHKYQLSAAASALALKLTANAKRDIDAMNPDDLFKTYGTHLITKYSMGGRNRSLVKVASSATTSKACLEAKAKLSYSGPKVGAEIEASYNKCSSQDKTSMAASVTSQTFGGDIGKHAAINIIQSYGGDKATDKTADYSAWSGSVDDTHQVFLGPDKDGLLPIWELASTTTRKDAIKNAFLMKVAKHPHIVVVKTEYDPDPPASKGDRASASVKFSDPNVKLIGGGGTIKWLDNTGQLAYASYPGDDRASWNYWGKAHQRSSLSWGVAYAVGISDPWNIWTVDQYDSGEQNMIYPGDVTPGRSFDVSSNCPDGCALVGGGAQLIWTGNGVLLFGDWPDKNSKKWMARLSELGVKDGYPVKIRMWAITLKSKLPGVKVSSKVFEQASSTNGVKSAASGVSQNYTLVGGGGQTKQSGNGIAQVSTFPLPNGTWFYEGKDHIIADIGSVTAYSIGVCVSTPNEPCSN